MIQVGNKNTNYGNWVPAVLLGILLAVMLVFTMYMKKCRDIFDFNKGAMMGKVHQYLVDHMDWNGNGTLLDIGCGAGALTIRCAKAYPKATLTGMDYWGNGATRRNSARQTQWLKELKAEGITEVHYIGNVEKEEFIPDFVTAPWMIKGVGLIYGKK